MRTRERKTNKMDHTRPGQRKEKKRPTSRSGGEASKYRHTSKAKPGKTNRRAKNVTREKPPPSPARNARGTKKKNKRGGKKTGPPNEKTT